ncbi:hypothetical protein CQW23_23713 [Capsicum baccatum]|uniref:non-specific serine/threonine protein kinase n=1 Tax=Capsicum baccatum TaxID=33114 RepID=A0A2G2VST7_CAPBA|nr:hypothetical protein CQW23_23713 [Capsicum baccatum]
MHQCSCEIEGWLSDGTSIAVKQLLRQSRQGNCELLNEIGMTSCLQHPNLVKIHDSDKSQLILDWSIKFKICVGIAKGIAFIHDELSLKVVHRDIKATNVLPDRDLNPKISDFGLARLTKLIIPILAVELLEQFVTYKTSLQACHLLLNGKIEELIDDKLGSQFNKEEAERVVKVALLCTSAMPSLKTVMSKVVRMLEGKQDTPDDIPEASMYTDDLRVKALKDFQRERQN